MTDKQKKITSIAAVAVVIVAILIYWLFFSSFSSSRKPSFVYIDSDDTPDSVYVKLDKAANPRKWLDSSFALSW